MARAVRAILSFVASAAITLLLLEGGLRLFPEAIPEGILKRFQGELRAEIAERRYLPNVSQTWQLERDDGGPPILLFKPGARIEYDSLETGEHFALVMDELGFCNPPGSLAADARAAIVTLGDSMAACLSVLPSGASEPVYANWPHLLRRLAGRSVYNLARGGYGPYEYVQLLKRFGIGMRPAVVVMQIADGNDLRDAARYHDYVKASSTEKARFPLRGGWEPIPVRYEPLLESVPGRNSYTYNLLVILAAQAAAKGMEQAQRWLAADGAPPVDFRFALRFANATVAMNPDNGQKDEVRTARYARDGRIALGALDEALESFVRLAREHGFVPVLSYAPPPHVAYAGVVEFADPELRDLMAWFHEAQASYLRAQAAALGFVLVDLTDALQRAAVEHGSRELLYYPSNLHFTPLGHRVAAETVAGALQERGVDWD